MQNNNKINDLKSFILCNFNGNTELNFITVEYHLIEYGHLVPII